MIFGAPKAAPGWVETECAHPWLCARVLPEYLVQMRLAGTSATVVGTFEGSAMALMKAAPDGSDRPPRSTNLLPPTWRDIESSRDSPAQFTSVQVSVH